MLPTIQRHAFFHRESRCHPGTRVRVLKKITDWINDPDPAQRIFWLSGPARTGKSVITQFLSGQEARREILHSPCAGDTGAAAAEH